MSSPLTQAALMRLAAMLQATPAASPYGGNTFGGNTFGGHTFGGNQYGASAQPNLPPPAALPPSADQPFQGLHNEPYGQEVPSVAGDYSQGSINAFNALPKGAPFYHEASGQYRIRNEPYKDPLPAVVPSVPAPPPVTNASFGPMGTAPSAPPASPPPAAAAAAAPQQAAPVAPPAVSPVANMPAPVGTDPTVGDDSVRALLQQQLAAWRQKMDQAQFARQGA